MIFSFCFASSSFCKEIDKEPSPIQKAINNKELGSDYKILEKEVENYCRLNSFSLEKEYQLVDKLIKFSFTPNLTESEILGSMLLAKKLQELIPKQFPNVSQKDIEEKHNSVGAAIFFSAANKQDKEKLKLGVDVLIREARLMSAAAQMALNIIYLYKIEGHPAYNSKILEHINHTAELGMKRSQYFLGTYYYYGNGVPQDKERGINLLKKSELGDADLLIAGYYLENGDKNQAKKYWGRAEKSGLAEGPYNLGICAQEEKSYEKAVDYFKRAIELDEKYHEAHLELARMYIEGWGVEKNERIGFEMMEKYSKKASGKTRGIINANLGLLYLHGRGTNQSNTKAKEYFQRAVEDGCEEAHQLLKSVN